MAWVVLVLGLLLVGGGGAAIVHGSPYMQMEFGWTEVIAGTVAMSGGVVTVALAAVLFSLAAVRRSLEQARPSPASPVEFVPTPAPVRPASPPPVDGPRVEPEGKPAAPAETEVRELAKPAWTAPRVLTRRSAAPRRAEDRPESAAPRLEPSLPDPPAEAAAGPVSIAGRYQSGGSSYVLFSDGTIEVESEAGKRRFRSMEELKAHIARERADAETG